MSVVTFVAAMAITWLAGAASAGTRDPAEITLRTDKVIIFKDGYSMFIRSGEGTCNDKGDLYIGDLPDSAVLGSFWATSDDGPPKTMRAGYHTTTNTIEKEVACTRYIDILEANKGNECSLKMSDGADFSGTIHNVLTRKGEKAVQPSYLTSIGARSTFSSRLFHSSQPPSPALTVVETQGSHFVLRTDEGDVLLPVNGIKTLMMKSITTTTTDVVTETARRKRLTLGFGRPGKKRKVTLMYFRPGMRWIPSYRVTLAPDKKNRASMVLQAEILNEAEDLRDVPVDIVVGVPNFRFRTIVSPLVLEKTLRDALRQAAPQIMGRNNQFSNALFTQRSREHVSRVPAQSSNGAGGTVELPAELTAGGTQDLFVYNLPPLTLSKGERAAVHIFNADVPYRDVYTWDVRIKRRDIATAPSGSGITSPLALSNNQVWHEVELQNNTKVPWTTGAAMIMDGMQPLAQELLTYTSPGGAVRVPVTVSVDTRGSVAETELGRQLKALHWDGYHYVKIRNRAELNLANRKDVDIDVEITLRFGGKADDISEEGEVVTAPYNSADWERYRGNPAVNNSTIITWKQTIGKGTTFKPAVRYHYYARH